MSTDRIPTGRGISPLADIRDGEGRDGRLARVAMSGMSAMIDGLIAASICRSR